MTSLQPKYDVDLYGDACIQDPWPHYAAMRALGPVVWLAHHECYALTQYDVVRAALRDHQNFSSAKGVAGDDFGCELLQGNTVASDPPRHSALRAAMAPPLRAAALESAKPLIEDAASALISDLLTRDGFDAVRDFAWHLPITVVRDLVGLPDYGQDKMLKWAAAAFNVLGCQNARGEAALADIQEMRGFIAEGAVRGSLKPGSWTDRVLDMVDDGELDADLAPFAIRDFINPSLDTTISAIGQLIWQLGCQPDLWRDLRNNEKLARNAANEAVRLATPIRGFSRRTATDVVIGKVTIPAESRVMMLFASANRDETVFPDPDNFRLDRPAGRHLGFGAGIHTCVGMHLALMEIEALISAMVSSVERIEVGEPEIAMNNTICAFARLPARFH